MCDLGPVSGMFASAGRTGDPNFIGPTRAASSTFVGPVRGSGSSGGMFDMFNSTTTGEMLKGIGGVASAFGTGADYDDLAAQRELRAGQILAATKQSIELKRLE